jgi:transposase-like protein
MGACTMDGRLGRRFFLNPQLTFQRRYEALRAVIAEDRSVTEVAARFGYKPAALRVMISRFNSQLRSGRVPPFFSLTAADVHQGGGAVKI